MPTVEESASLNQACRYARPPVAEGILVILMGLTAKTALDHFFVAVPVLKSTTVIWDSFARNPRLHLFLLVQLVVLFFTAFRFYFGSIRYHQVRGPHKEVRTLIFDMGWNTIIFVGFYLCALAVRSATSFYFYVALLHLCDLLWFLISLIRPTEESQHLISTLRHFITYDLWTLGMFGLITLIWWLAHLSYGPPYLFQILCLVVLMVVGIIDFKQNSAFYRGERTA